MIKTRLIAKAKSGSSGGSVTLGASGMSYTNGTQYAAKAEEANTAKTAQYADTAGSADEAKHAASAAALDEKASAALDEKYLSKVNADTAAGKITFADGMALGDGTAYGADKDGAATMKSVTAETIAASTSVGNGDFVSGYAAGSGWSVYSTLVNKVKKWTLEIDNLVVRSALKVYEMVVSQLVGENDNRIFAAMAEVVSLNKKTFYLYISTKEEKMLNPFRKGDVLECQQFNTDGASVSKHYRLTVQSVADGTIKYNKEMCVRLSFQNFTDLTNNGGTADALVTAGDTLVRVDSTSDESRKGIVGITSVGEKTPYLDVIYGKTTETNPLKVRMGNLSGVTDENFGGALSGWGLYAENAYLKGQVHAESGYFKGEIQATSGTFNGTVNATDGTFKGRIEADEGHFNNGTFDNATVTGTITATAGKIAGYTIEGNMLTYADPSTRYKGWISPESICLYQSPQGGGAAERSVEIGNGNNYGVTDGVTYALKIVTRQYAISTGLSINLQNKDSTDSITGETSVDNFAKYAIKLYGGSIGGLKLHTAILNGGTDANPTEIGLLDSVVILQSGGSYKLPDFGTKSQYDGHVVMVRVMTSDNIKLYASGNNKILHERWDIDSCWGVNYAGLSATFVFVPAYTDSNSGAQGVWIEFRNSWNF